VPWLLLGLAPVAALPGLLACAALAPAVPGRLPGHEPAAAAAAMPWLPLGAALLPAGWLL
jgi:hypothetical protein